MARKGKKVKSKYYAKSRPQGERNSRVETFRGKNMKGKMTGSRSGKLSDDLRNFPVEFVSASEFRLNDKQEVKEKEKEEKEEINEEIKDEKDEQEIEEEINEENEENEENEIKEEKDEKDEIKEIEEQEIKDQIDEIEEIEIEDEIDSFSDNVPFPEVSFDYSDFSDLSEFSDNMSELDDDQIFALAQSTIYSNEDFDIIDQLDNEISSLIKSGPSEKKKMKRQMRQEMLKNKKTHPLWRLYIESMTVFDVLDEIRKFTLQKNIKSLVFPPLDANARWYVMKIAEKHGLKTTVEGKDNVKYVRAVHTSRTNPLVPQQQLNSFLNKRKTFPRTDFDFGDRKTRTTAKVRDGQLVAQDATELEEGNFGRQLLKKMGWTEGSGLGKERVGITAPIAATVKLTKRGLQ